jgi:hypothetical protein
MKVKFFYFVLLVILSFKNGLAQDVFTIKHCENISTDYFKCIGRLGLLKHYVVKSLDRSQKIFLSIGRAQLFFFKNDAHFRSMPIVKINANTFLIKKKYL